jgi:hypothetical protein
MSHESNDLPPDAEQLGTAVFGGSTVAQTVSRWAG